MPWMRRVEIIVTSKKDATIQRIFKDHRIDFEVRSTVGWPADTANITLFNLSIEEVKFLQGKNYGDMYIEIRAGYDEDSRAGVSGGLNQHSTPNGSQPRINIEKILPTVFSGIITNAIGFRRAPEHVTQLFCISKAYGVATDFTQMKKIAPGTKLVDAIQSMCKDYGFGTVSTYGVSSELMETVLPRGRVFHDTFLVEMRELLGEFNLLFTMTTGEIQIFPETFGDKDAVNRMAQNRGKITMDANSVIGNPVAGICTYTLSTFMNPAIQPGMIVDVSPLLGTELLANGFTAVSGQGIVLNTDQSVFRWAMEDKYFIMEVVHHGSTHTLDFQTTLSSIIGGNTMMGGREQVWQDMYANSGLAMESY